MQILLYYYYYYYYYYCYYHCKCLTSNVLKKVLFLQLSRRTLHEAAISGRCDVVKLLLESGKDVDQTDEVASLILRLNVSVLIIN